MAGVFHEKPGPTSRCNAVYVPAERLGHMGRLIMV
jgi:hypothetical protein